jgi:hypothetical protein
MVTKILDELEEQNVIRDMCENMRVSSNDIDDLIQEVYMILLEYNRDKLIEMYKNRQLRYFIVGIIQRQYRSNTSPFYKKYKRYYTLIDENNCNNGEVNDDVDDFE